MSEVAARGLAGLGFRAAGVVRQLKVCLWADGGMVQRDSTTSRGQGLRPRHELPIRRLHHGTVSSGRSSPAATGSRGKGCPWANRTSSSRNLLGLHDVLSMGLAVRCTTSAAGPSTGPRWRRPVLGIRTRGGFLERDPHTRRHHRPGGRRHPDGSGWSPKTSSPSPTTSFRVERHHRPGRSGLWRTTAATRWKP